MERIRSRKSNYKSIVLVPTELKRRAANYSDCLPSWSLIKPYWAWPLGASVIGFDWVLGYTAVECLGAGGLVRPIHAQPLASKCRVEPTGRYWGSRK